MKNTSKRTFLFITFLMVFFLFSTSTFSIAQEEKSSQLQKKEITSWLVVGPFPAPLTAFHQDKKKKFSCEDLLKFEDFDISSLWPKENAPFEWHDGSTVNWQTVQPGEKGVELASPGKHPSIAYLGVYLDVPRWTKAKVSVTSSQLLQVQVNGKVMATKAKAKPAEKKETAAEEEKATAEMKLETGKHFLLVKTVYDPKSEAEWTIEASLEVEEKFAGLTFSTSPEQRMTIKHLLDTHRITSVSISPDGSYAALSMSQSLPPTDETEAWVEIYQLPERRLIQTYRGGMKISRVNWAPTGNIFSYTSSDKSGGTIWIVDLKGGTSIPLLKNVKDLGNHTWSPTGKHLIYSITEKPEPDKRKVKRFQNLADRQPWWRNRSYLYKITVPGGVRQRLTAGELSTNLHNISPDGKQLLFTRSIVDYEERPFSKTEFYTLTLETLEAKMLLKTKWFGTAEWGPLGKRLLILGGPSLFGEIGVNVPPGTIPNEYDAQAYLYDLETSEVEAITKDFDPSIDQAMWSRTENCIYFTTTDRSYRHLYKYDLKKKTFSLIDCGVEVLERIDIAQRKPMAVYTGSSASVPSKAFVLDLKKNRYHLLKGPGKNDFAEVKFGKVERWTFKNKQNVEIEGRIYYPPDFDPEKKYPCIVYYYGGTSPVTRDFGGRYPKNLYAAQDYVIYVLQPSGAVGFGQEFSSLHVNDWGKIVADEIIDGVKKFLAAHHFIDPKKVGCIGASFGGFTTMLLLTRTDIFASGVAHAGISSISSYWGEGYWGYGYSSIATANSFPWNRKDIYIDQSPLFQADKITTPLLLLHGSVDTNVPPGESTQLFTALKILGREVEYIQIMGENHHILTYNKRILWTQTILAWFDKWLKSQPEWWTELYPDK
jgi:dipeptidyl aminopeptidase/acylaminoacyl peptidase